MILIIVFVFMCLLRNHTDFGDMYYAVSTVQDTYISVDEVLEDVAQNWRGLQEKDVSFTIKVANLPCFVRTTHLPWENSPTVREGVTVRVRILPVFRRKLLHPTSVQENR